MFLFVQKSKFIPRDKFDGEVDYFLLLYIKRLGEGYCAVNWYICTLMYRCV